MIKLKVKRPEEVTPLIGGDERILTKKTTFESLLAKAVGINDECRDYTVPRHLISKSEFFATDSNDSGVLSYFVSEDEKRSSAMSEFALGQLCVKLGVPARYIQKCISSGEYDLASENMNTWLRNYSNNSMFIREYRDGVRAVLSGRYSVLDTPEILEVICENLPVDEYTIKGHFLSPERFHARIVQKEMLHISGEDLFAGIQIDSSDVGRSTLSVKFMLFKQICTNGLCITKGGGLLFLQKHIGINREDFRDIFSRSVSDIPLLIGNAEYLVDTARRDTGDFSVEKFDEAHMKRFISRIRENAKLPEDGAQQVVNLMIDKYGSSRWGLVNSLTEVAQKYSLERRIEIEKYAGDILFLS